MAVMTELGLSFQQSMALMRLEPDEPMPMSTLALALQCDNSNVTGIVDRMEAHGLVERRPSDRDRRVKAVALTPHGEAVREEVRRRAGTPQWAGQLATQQPLAAATVRIWKLLRRG